MEIRGISGVNPLENNSSKVKASQSSAPLTRKNDDSLNVSEEARLLRDEEFITQVLAQIPDVDHTKIEQVKERLDNGYYDKKEVLDVLTDRLIKALGL